MFGQRRVDIERKRERGTHKLVLPAEQLPARLRLRDLAHAHFPRAALASRHRGAERPADNLVPVADADDLDAVLCQDGLDKVDEADDPRVVVEGIEFCGGGGC